MISPNYDQQGEFLQKTLQHKKDFLSAFAMIGTISGACRKIGLTRNAFYEWKEHDKEFVKAFEDARQEYVECLEEELHRRAYAGVEEPVHYKGKKVDTIRKFSDTLLIFLLKANAPEKYRETHKIEGTLTAKIETIEVRHVNSE